MFTCVKVERFDLDTWYTFILLLHLNISTGWENSLLMLSSYVCIENVASGWDLSSLTIVCFWLQLSSLKTFCFLKIGLDCYQFIICYL